MLHISVLERLVVFFVLIRSDNMSVMSHINKLGGTRSQILVEWTKRMFAWCVERGSE